MRTTTLILSCLFLLSCQKAVVKQKQLSSDEYDVYSAIINNQLDRYKTFNKDGHDTIRFIVVYHQTIKGSVLASNDSNISLTKHISSQELYKLASQYAKVSSDTLEINQQSINAPIKIISYENYSELNKYVYTQGTNLFSRVGFNDSRTKALVYDRIYSEWGSEMMYLLTKESGKWKVIDCLIYSMDRYELLSDLKPTRKPTVGTAQPFPDATIQFDDSTSETK